uniref:Sperm-tail PG-rich repeat containing 1 n=1 Tax=Gasterosteus aculeatus aculeatus TaxID=481459 RepID=A0AAQ4Q7T1_GASAC|nr:O(6)-methylguanine-induced apoptosis 2 [Gasterosteus aculeatus aculeatus]
MGRSRPGHTHKRPAHTASSSMRTKYQRVVMANQQKKGFLCEDRIFSSPVCQNEHPGPDSFGLISSTVVESPCFATEGNQTSQAFSNPRRGLPVPYAHNLPSTFVNKNHFSFRTSSVFRLPVAVRLDGPKHSPPAPDLYDVGYGRRDRWSSVDGASPFLSKAGHNSFFQIEDRPSPCHYEVSDHLIQNAYKAIVSPFKSKSQRIPPPIDSRLPGAGAYSPYQTPLPGKRAVLLEGFYLAIAAPAMVVDPPSPGLGRYIRDCNGLAERPMSTAVFASRTERISQRLLAYTRPGPGFYEPKQSFCRNDSTVWLPV